MTSLPSWRIQPVTKLSIIISVFGKKGGERTVFKRCSLPGDGDPLQGSGLVRLCCQGDVLQGLCMQQEALALIALPSPTQHQEAHSSPKWHVMLPPHQCVQKRKRMLGVASTLMLLPRILCWLFICSNCSAACHSQSPGSPPPQVQATSIALLLQQADYSKLHQTQKL